MAAHAHPHSPQIISLQQLDGNDIASLLDEEVRIWQRRLHWDFASSANLIQRYVSLKALNGFAVWAGDHIAGYSYYVLEEHKALLGDLFLLDTIATPSMEQQLLEAMFHAIHQHSQITRVESQLMMLRWTPDMAKLSQQFPHLSPRSFLRNLMFADISKISVAPHPGIPANVEISPWNELAREEAAYLIAVSYQNHIDSKINDQYLNLQGTRKFLKNITLYPGCGEFSEGCSFIARDRTTGSLIGLCMASVVAQNVGHVTQLCVAPSAHGFGIGHELMRHSLLSLLAMGCDQASLTVTAENRGAIRLYQKFGFEVIRNFSAHVWQKNQSYN